MSFTTQIVLNDDLVDCDVEYSFDSPDPSTGFPGSLYFKVTDGEGKEVRLDEEQAEVVREECVADDKYWNS